MKILKLSKVHFKNRPLPEWLTYYIFVLPFFFAFLQGFLGLPGVVKYTIDAAYVLVTGLLFIKKKLLFDKKMIPFIIFILVFIFYTAVVYLFNYISVFYYLWGFRNNFRFYFVFLAFCMVFCEDDAKFCLKFMDVLFWINAVVSLFQFFVLGYKQDYLGGIFGVTRGCNGYSLVFFSIVITLSVLQFMNKEKGFFGCFAKCTVALTISAMAELKIFFVLFTLILLFATIFTSFSWRKLFLVLVCAVIVSLAGSLLTEIFGENYSMTAESIINYMSIESYADVDDLGRTNAVSTISNSIMTSDTQRFFGLGLGNCDTSTFEIFNTPFYQIYSGIHYNWFSSAFLFLETGYIGLGIYFAFFVICFVMSFNISKKQTDKKSFCQLAMIMSLLCIVITFYNSSLRTEIAYMVYFVLALPFIISKPDIKYKRRLDVHR